MPRALLANYPQLQWLDLVTSAEAGFRNKKLVVASPAKNPTLGIVDYQHGLPLIWRMPALWSRFRRLYRCCVS